MEPCVSSQLSHLLYGICVKIFSMNRYISKSYTTSKNTIDRQYAERGTAVVSTITSYSIFSILWSTVDYLSPNERCFSLVRYQVQILANPGIRQPVFVKTLLRDTFFSRFTHLFHHVFVFFSLLDETHINQIICHVYYTGFQVSWLVSKFCFDLQQNKTRNAKFF